MNFVALAARFTVGVVLFVAGWQKAGDPAQFIRDIWGYRLVSEPAAYWISAYLPYLEMVTGLALVLRVQRNGARLLAGVMLAAFLVALGSAAARGLDVSCGCFGSARPTSALAWPIVRDVLLLACLAIDIRWSRKTAVIAEREGAEIAPG